VQLVDHVEHPVLPTIVGAILDEIIGPDVVRVFRPQTDTRAIVEPQPSALRLLDGYLQPLTSPDPSHPPEAHRPAGSAQHLGDAPITVTAALDRERDNLSGQSHLVAARLRYLALRRAMLAQSTAGEPLRDAVFKDHTLHASTATCGA